MLKERRKHTIDILFVVTLFCVFAFSIIMLMGTGAGVYAKIVDGMEINYESRTASTYLFNKIHRADRDGNISTGMLADSPALVMTEEIDNILYCTYLYHYDGALMELFTRYGQDISPEFGTVIMELKNYELTEISKSLYRFSFTTKEGESSVLYVHTRTDKITANE